MPQIVEIANDVPYSDCIYWWLQVAADRRLETLINLSRQYESQYLAWEEVRKGRNPYFEIGTGFEGYLVGVCDTPDEALNRLLQVGQRMLTNLTRLHPHDHRFHSRLMKTITGETVDARAMAEWYNELGAQLGKLRCNLLYNQKADQFHSETYRIIQRLPVIDYLTTEESISQRYAIMVRSTQGHKVIITPSMLKPADQTAWMVMQAIGKFGHPLIREYMRSTVH